jgi:hypothetical protein
MLHRATGSADWIESTLGAHAKMKLPEIGIEIPLAELYADTDLLE